MKSQKGGRDSDAGSLEPGWVGQMKIIDYVTEIIFVFIWNLYKKTFTAYVERWNKDARQKQIHTKIQNTNVYFQL